MHSKFPWTTHPHTPTAVFDGDGRRIIDQWVAPESRQPTREEIARIIDPDAYQTLDEFSAEQITEDVRKYIIRVFDRRIDAARTKADAILALANASSTPTPLDPETAAANAVMIAGLPGLIEALDAMVLVCGRTGDALEDFEEQAEVFLRETGFMRPGKDMPAGWDSEDNSGARRAKYSEWVQSKLTAGRAALASIGRTL